MGDLLTQQQISRTEAIGISRYYELTKPRIVSLLVFTSLTATYVAQQSLKYPFSILEWLITGVAITAGSAGCNVLTCYIDRDIDAIMHRTRHRPIPSGRITPKNALRFGLLLVAISLLLALTFNILSFTWMALGIVDNVIVYSLVLKRRSPLNILLGGFSGGLPVLFGWSAVTPGPIGSFSLVSVLMAGLVFLWIPIHIWFLAVSSKADYARANIPMLPAVVGTVTALPNHSLLAGLHSILSRRLLSRQFWTGVRSNCGNRKRAVARWQFLCPGQTDRRKRLANIQDHESVPFHAISGNDYRRCSPWLGEKSENRSHPSWNLAHYNVSYSLRPHHSEK